MKQILNNNNLSFRKNNPLVWLLFLVIILPTENLQAKSNEELSKITKANSKCQRPEDIVTDKTEKKKITFSQWLDLFKKDALAKGISKKTITAAFKNVQPIQKVIELDRRQTEYSVTFSKYLSNSISTHRISQGKTMLKKHATLLANIKNKYGVQPQVLVSLWAMESNFGGNMGNFSTIKTLATLAHEGRRHDFFRNELFCALSILDQGHIPVSKMKSSWAGAMGQPQFMPSTFVYYAADGNADGKKDIWNSTADVLASAANYLKKIGWEADKSWGGEVKLPKKFEPYHARFSEEKSLKEWHSLGVTKASGNPLTIDETIKGSIILPSGIKGAAFVVFKNFKVIREWNKSMNYALAVGHLADRLVGYGRLVGKAPKGEKPLSRKQAILLQTNLKKLGFYKDKVDGMVGLNSRGAIRNYQKFIGIPADAYPSTELILRVNKDALRGIPSEQNK